MICPKCGRKITDAVIVGRRECPSCGYEWTMPEPRKCHSCKKDLPETVKRYELRLIGFSWWYCEDCYLKTNAKITEKGLLLRTEAPKQ